ncbi:flavin monoamine oxidase family protein [Cyclonatronum proteinivorum]|nr:FAD-dependent oxidoreductase [Cyclonatronum proteinivorum]
MKTSDILILGAGLSGLLTAHLLRQQRPDLRLRILEARPEPGGRIRTLRPEAAAPLEMGATWLSPDHRRLQKLLTRLGIETIPQRMGSEAVYEFSPAQPPQRVQLPSGEPQSFRIKGGTDRIITALISSLGEGELVCNAPPLAVRAVRDEQEGSTEAASANSGATTKMLVETPDEGYAASVIISTLPPRLLTHSIIFDPPLPGTLHRIASQTHTWMSESIKAGFSSTHPRLFRQEDGAVTTLFSNAGPFTELYDHSSERDHALIGFLHPGLSELTPEDREAAATKQLNRLLGTQAGDHGTYYECNWKQEAFTHSPHSGFIPPHQHNGHPVFRQPLLGGRLILSGTETASVHPGYMEGAVASAEHAAEAAAAWFSSHG